MNFRDSPNNKIYGDSDNYPLMPTPGIYTLVKVIHSDDNSDSVALKLRRDEQEKPD